jgi:cysteine synthase A
VTRKYASSILELVGNTPLVKLGRITPPQGAAVLAKLEVFNPGGSVKDRISLNMIEQAEKQGLLRPGSVIVEPTSGNTGIGLAMIGAAKGYRVKLVMPDAMSFERLQILKAYGAEVILTPADEGMMGAVEKAREIVGETPGAFMPNQFSNPENPATHRKTTARELLAQTDGRIDAFVAGVGTGGTISGTGEVLKKQIPGLKIYAVEPKSSPVLSGGKPGSHMIQGIGAGFVPEVLNRSIIDEVIPVSDENAYETASRLAREEGIFAGISAGAACFAALKVARGLKPDQTVVVVFPDSGERYLSLSQYFSG